MNQPEIKGDQNVMMGKLKQNWGKVTDDDLKSTEGKKDEPNGRIQRRMGEIREAIGGTMREKTSKDFG